MGHFLIPVETFDIIGPRGSIPKAEWAFEIVEIGNEELSEY